MKTLAILAAVLMLSGCAFFNPPDTRPGYRPWQGNGPDVPGSYTNALPVLPNSTNNNGWLPVEITPQLRQWMREHPANVIETIEVNAAAGGAR